MALGCSPNIVCYSHDHSIFALNYQSMLPSIMHSTSQTLIYGPPVLCTYGSLSYCNKKTYKMKELYCSNVFRVESIWFSLDINAVALLSQWCVCPTYVIYRGVPRHCTWKEARGREEYRVRFRGHSGGVRCRRQRLPRVIVLNNARVGVGSKLLCNSTCTKCKKHRIINVETVIFPS